MWSEITGIANNVANKGNISHVVHCTYGVMVIIIVGWAYVSFSYSVDACVWRNNIGNVIFKVYLIA